MSMTPSCCSGRLSFAPALLVLVALFGCADDPKSTESTEVDGGGDGSDGGDGGDGGEETDFPTTSCADHGDPCVEVVAGDVEGLFEAANLLEDGMTIVLGAGEWQLDNQITFRNADQLSLYGQGMDLTILDFGLEEVQTNGIDVISDDFLVQDLTVLDAKKDGVRVEDSDGVVMRRVRAAWTVPESAENGAYGLYPVKSTRVLIEECEAHNASDAGIYVGQTIQTIVRNNLATGNVAGIEIENTQFADVHGNTATGNTGGLLIFDLPGNPIVGRDIWVHDNVVTDNNAPNFAPGGTVASIPSGTGTILLASRRVVIENNTYANNDSSDIAIISGLAIEGNPDTWMLSRDELVGSIEGVTLPGDESSVYNFLTRNVVVKGNTHSGSGSAPDMASVEDREIGFLLGMLYLGDRVDDVLYDAIGESAYSNTDASGNSNDNMVCVGGNDGGSFASLDLETLAGRMRAGDFPNPSDLFRPAAPYAPFDCTALEGGDIPAVTLD